MTDKQTTRGGGGMVEPDLGRLTQTLGGQSAGYGVGLEGLQANQRIPQRRTASDDVADTLRKAINDGVLADGTPLNQVAIAKMLGVSRVPVREAMHQLQAEGLITVRPHHGAEVAGLTVERVSELFDIQAMLEEYITRRAVPNIDKDLLAGLRRLVAQMRATKQLPEWLELNAEFHIELNRPSGAQLAMELAQQMRARGQRYLNLWSEGKGIDRPRDANREHTALLDLIAAGDVEGAAAAAKQHVLNTRDKAIKYHDAHAQPTH